MKILKLLSVGFFLVSFTISAQIKEKKLDKLIENTLEAFDVPGISVGIIKDGKTVYAKGFGKRSLATGKPMNKNTLVGIASNSKGFTAFALAMLVDDGKLNWDDKVREHLPEFRLKDAWVTENFTVKDLLTHRSGLGLGGGDLMFFPEGNSYSAEDILDHLQYIEPTSSFRSKFEYNNNMFIVAGEVLERLSGMTWEEFIEERILKPVGMTATKASYNRVTDKSNIIDAHARTEGEVIQIPHDWSETANPAGGLVSNITDMLTWAEFLMNDAVTKDGERLLSEKQLHNLWQMQMPLPVSKENSYDTHFYGYGLGWFVKDVKGGFKEVTHTGGLLGTVTQFTLLPEKDLGIVVLTNQMSGSAFNTITNTIKDSYLDYENRDWLKKLKPKHDKWLAKNDSIKTAVYQQVKEMQKKGIALQPEQVIGTYKDNWFGEVTISKENGKLKIASEESEQLKGELLPYNTTTYVAKWNNRSFDADVFVLFNLDKNGKAQSVTLEYIAPITDFSFNFGDLRLERVEE
ncbi:serine hydrolase [Haloflavibacter putidus]|uniref:Serine hydrolase n=1 Tax=Haloflavibacter putidus TaxID=2576776 RepID=A0A507ZV23_9FLAO|nr:serine hydrolase [Haloflavibacter putidus]TQD39598.1 serine hydrolase [Haloflavibacter putidus]